MPPLFIPPGRRDAIIVFIGIFPAIGGLVPTVEDLGIIGIIINLRVFDVCAYAQLLHGAFCDLPHVLYSDDDDVHGLQHDALSYDESYVCAHEDAHVQQDERVRDVLGVCYA
jgi:hypothetical protein